MNSAILSLTLPWLLTAPPMPPIQLEYPFPPAPFLFVQVLPPKGTTTTWYAGTTAAVAQKTPTSVALRPGYIYRLELSEIPETKGAKLYPTLEVRGSIHPKPGMDITKYPVPVVFTKQDIQQALEGRFIEKVIILEDPSKADPITTKPDQLLEYKRQTKAESIKDAQDRGRIVMIVRLGERGYTPQELVLEHIPGSIWFPSQPKPPMPSRPPCVPYGGIALYDPIAGPKASTVECLYDGGDSKRILGIGINQQLSGLDPSDTAIEYQTPTGKRVSPSNRVCICVPRYIAFRHELLTLDNTSLNRIVANHRTERTNDVNQKRHTIDIAKNDGLAEYDTKTRLSGITTSKGVIALDQLSGRPMAIASLSSTKVVAQVRELEELTGYPSCKMMLVKWMEPKKPEKIGEIVKFHLRYHNATNIAMTEVIVSDSLTARLEYIEGSAKSDRASTFTAKTNEAGSLTLRWAVDGKLQPGETGLITFQARIR